MIDHPDLIFPHFIGLVREAAEAQDAFDMWDDGFTFGGVFEPRREVDLDTVVREWDEANAELIKFVLENGPALQNAIEAQRATTPKSGVVGDESAAPKGFAK